jgi:hypothetical protein
MTDTMSRRATSQANTTAMRKCLSRWHLDSFRFGLRIVVADHRGYLASGLTQDIISAYLSYET